MSLHVLLIDDHTLFRVGLEGLLASRGIEVVASVASGQECLRLVEELNPDIILLDMRMPGIDGLGVLKMLREAKLELPSSCSRPAPMKVTCSNPCARAPRATC